MSEQRKGTVTISLKDYHDLLSIEKVVKENHSYLCYEAYDNKVKFLKKLNESEGMLMDTIRNLREEMIAKKEESFKRGKKIAVEEIKELNWFQFKLLKLGIKKI